MARTGTVLPTGQDTLLRILKLSEEVGEVAAAVIGATGQNPRKGVTHSWQDVESELCNVIITAMVAPRTLTPDASGVFAAHLLSIAERSGHRVLPDGVQTVDRERTGDHAERP